MPKPDLTDVKLSALLRPLGTVVTTRPLTGGMFATVLAVTLHDGSEVVVKASSTDATQLCRYERGIAGTEAQTFRLIAANGIAVPEVVLTDFSHGAVDADIVVTRFISGTPWQERELDDVANDRVKQSLGALMARLHDITAPAFGYPAEQADMRAANWRDAFDAMVRGIMQDAADTGTDLPTARILRALERHGDALDDVRRAAIVHNDLWPANIFLDAKNSIVGVIDTERTVWGDPLLDLVGADQMGLWDINPHVLAGNTAAGGVLEAELAAPTGPIRFALYRLYYSLILLTEIKVRGYQDAWAPAHRRACQDLVDAALEQLLSDDGVRIRA